MGWQPAIDPIAPQPVNGFVPGTITAGEQLASAGNCASCHTIAGGPPFGGGLGLETGFGVVYSTNISPDPQTGIGNWSEPAFARAMREGVARDGTQLLPAFPYTHFTKLTDDDVRALYAYFMTRPAVVQANRPDTLRFPFNVRALQVGWKWLYFKPGRFVSDPAKNADWSRGAYLAEGIAHCAACHTPRNRWGAERADAPYAGAPLDGWLAPALNAANPAPMPWTQQDLYTYLRKGESELHGTAAGPMADVVHEGLAKLPDSDVLALATYFAAGNGSAALQAAAPTALKLAMSRRLVDKGRETEPGANLYLAACATCHYSPIAAQGSLSLSTALTSTDPSNFIQTVLQGVGGHGAPGPYMPAFAAALTDDDVALLAGYLRHTRSDLPAWPNLPQAVAARRSTSVSTP
jgi:mono/diheme cytochrome c family protein